MTPNTTTLLTEKLFNDVFALGDHLIVTVVSNYMGSQSYDIKDGIIGYAPLHKELLLEHLEECLSKHGSIVIRKFLTDKTTVDTPNGPMRLPIKEIYGAFIKDGIVHHLSEGAMQSAYETDAMTGEPLSPEPAVVYCEWPSLQN